MNVLINLFLTTCFLLITITEGTCYCPIESVRNPDCQESWFYDDGGDTGDALCWQKYYLQHRPCSDYELQGECIKAQVEIEDWLSGKYNKRDKILRAMHRDGKLTLQELSATDAAVTIVLEDLKINLGMNLECTKGLLTSSRNKNTHSSCHSEDLLKLCKHAQDTAPEFFSSVIPGLRNEQKKDPNVSGEFISLFEFQFKDKTNTIDVHCNVTAKVEIQLSGATKTAGNIIAGIFLSVIGMILVL